MPPPDAAPKAPAAYLQAPLPQPQIMASSPGIMRDGTRLAKPNYIDGLWCRFYQDLPRKILGYQEQVRAVNGICRNINIFNNGGFCIVHSGSDQALQRYSIQLPNGPNTGLIDRMPSGYVPNPTNLWQTTTIFQTSGGTTELFAAATPSLNDITADVSSTVYSGDVLGTDHLSPVPMATFTGAIGPTSTTLTVTAVGYGAINVGDQVLGAGVQAGTFINGFGTGTGGTGTYTVNNSQTVSSEALTTGNLTTSGGLVAVGPYLFLYGHDGIVEWSVPAFPNDFFGVGAGDSHPVSDKIIVAFPLRGQSAPAIILWSLSSLIVGNFVGGDTLWNFSTVTTNGSILSANSVVEHNGIYYWMTTSGFSRYAGVMQDIPNEFNKDYFLSNLNFAARNRAFAVKVPRWSEIWFCVPTGMSSDPNYAFIYNYEKNYWYDTPLPNGGRGAGQYNVTFSFPIMSGVVTNEIGGTSMWQHEFGLDEVSGPKSTPKAIPSYIETHEFSLAVPQQIGAIGRSQALSYSTLEPDFNQVGDLLFSVYSRHNARAPFESPNGGAPYVIPATFTNAEDENTDFKWTGRLTSFLIESNSLGGNFIWGSPLIHAKPSDTRRIG